MKTNTNPFTHAIAAKKKQIGLWVSLSHNYSAEIVATSNYDWALLDMEHSPNDLISVLGQLQAFSASDTTAIVRPPWNDSVMVKRLLDAGAEGLLFPMVQSVEEAEYAVAATRYPPRGVRGVSGSTRANAFGRKSDYFDRVEDETTVLVQIETRQALECAEQIADVDGISGVFFGPADIAADIGKLGQPNCDEVWDLILPVAKALMQKGMPVGTLMMDPQIALKLIAEGFTFVAVGSDLGLLAKGADQLCEKIKSEL